MKLIIVLLTMILSIPSFGEEIIPLKGILLKKLETKVQLKNFNKKDDVKISIIDTGLSKGFRQNYSFVQNGDLSVLESNHGVHVHGIVYLLSNNKNISHYNFFKSNNGNKQTKDFVTALNTAINSEPRIINLSLGGEGIYLPEKDLIKKGQSKGIIFVTASGNNGQDLSNSTYYPASYANEEFPNIISVANFLDSKTINRSSNYGGKTFIGTNGTNIPSFCPYSTNPCYLTGTSQATPIITSAITLLLERYPYLSVKQIKYILGINSIKNESTLAYTEVGYFSWDSFTRWLNKNYTEKDIFPNQKELQLEYQNNPIAINTRN